MIWNDNVIRDSVWMREAVARRNFINEIREAVARRNFIHEIRKTADFYDGRVPRQWIDALHNVLDVTEKEDT